MAFPSIRARLAPAMDKPDPTPPPPERNKVLVSPETMPEVLRASRGGRSKETRERVRKRCQANRPNLPDFKDRS